MAFCLVGLVKLYRLTLSPWVGQQCRFHPTCSCYAIAAIQTHGPWVGLWLTARRLSRCHPFHAGGIDEVPPHPLAKRGVATCEHRDTHMIGDL
ncbi:MAG: membrane protein insertion efficiency factor YidD [Pseudomonadales bacterium]|nr:membrane protein insertion efficiency factor YidD [Pseudomonadales bacterium]